MERKNVYNSSTDQQEIDLVELFMLYIEKLPLLIAAVVFGALFSGLFTHFCIADRYTAVSRMYMVSASSSSVVDLSDLNIGASLSNDYVELMKTRPVIQGVIDSLGLDYTYENLAGMISLSVVPNTRIVKISATSTDPWEAMSIANEMARISREQLPKVMDAPTPSIVEEAILPKSRSYPSMSRNMAAGALAALFAVMGVFTVIYLMDDTIRTSEDCEKEFGIMPLAVIPEGMIEGLAKIDDSRSAGRFRIPGLPLKKRRKEEFIESWTSAGPDRITKKEAVPAYESVSLPMLQNEAQPWFVTAAEYAGSEEPAVLSAAVAAVAPGEPAWELRQDGSETEPVESAALPAGSPDSVAAASSGEPTWELRRDESETEPVESTALPAGSPDSEAAASSEEPVWELRPAVREYKTDVPVWELKPVSQELSKPVSRNNTFSGTRRSRSSAGEYSSIPSYRRRQRAEKKRVLDFAIGTVFLVCAGLLGGILLGQSLSPLTPAARSKTTAQDSPAVPSQSPVSQSAGGDTGNFSHIVVYMDNMQRIVEERYIGQDGSVVRNEKGYAIVRYQYDDSGNLSRTSYFDENSNPVFVPELGYSSMSITYDGLGNKIGETYYNTDGSPVVNPQ